MSHMISANCYIKRTVRGAVTLSAIVCATGIAATAGCSSGAPGAANTVASTEQVATTEAALNDDHSGSSYDNDCKSDQVPLPPAWGTPNIGSHGSKWVSNGSFPESDSFFPDIGAGNIWYVTSSNPAGICVINAHDTGTSFGEFDVICQGTSGKACFWAGDQSSIPPSTSVAVLENSWTQGQGSSLVTHGLSPNANECTQCHTGENVFLTHYILGASASVTGSSGPAGHPITLAVANPASVGIVSGSRVNVTGVGGTTEANGSWNVTVSGNSVTLLGSVFAHSWTSGGAAQLTHALNLNGTPGWMPTSWYDPVVATGYPQNQGPDPFPSYYPLSNSAPACTSCHTQGGVGGRFPALSRYDVSTTGGGFCTIFAEVTNRPGNAGGMPPGPGNTCTPGVNCAAQTDPFVMAMLDTCNGMAISRANSPASNDAFGSSTPYNGFWDHAVVDKWSGTTHKVLLMDDFFNDSTNKFAAWAETDYTVHLTDTYFRTTTWLKGSGAEGSNFTIAARDQAGSIFESVGPNNRRDVTLNAAVLAAGSPSAYVRHDGYNTIVYRGVDNFIYESYWDGVSQWYTNPLPGQNTTALGDPLGYNRGSSSSVVYKCGNTQLCEERLVQGTWYFRDPPFTTSAGILTFVPMPIVSQFNGYEHTIFYTGRDGVHAIVDPCEPWYSCALTDSLIYASPNVSSAAVPYNSQNGGTAVVFITDAGGQSNPSALVQIEALLNGGWTATTLYSTPKSTETLVGDPTGYLSQGPYLNTVLFRNTSGKLYQTQWSNSQNKYVKTTITL